MNVLGLDLSLTGTGWATRHGHGIIRSKLKGPERLVDIRDQILAIIALYDIDLTVIEGYSYNSRNGGERIGELGGVIRVALHEHDTPYVEITPAGRARYATGAGNASKDRVVAAVAARTGIAFATSDECDAFVLRAMAMDFYGEPVMQVPGKNREALCAVDWPTMKGGQ